MNFLKLSCHIRKLCVGFFISCVVFLAGCGGGGGGSTSASLSSIVVLPASLSVTSNGGTGRFTAIGKYSDGTAADLTSKVIWQSASSVVASVSAGGTVSGGALGATSVTASLQGITSTLAQVTVTLQPVATTGLALGRWDHTANLLPASGVAGEAVVVAGGYTAVSGVWAAVASSELYDPGTDQWQATGSLNTARGDHTSTRLKNGQALVAGGDGQTLVTGADGLVQVVHLNSLSSCELYERASGTWSLTKGSLNEGRSYHTATLLSDGRVLAVGGAGNNGRLASAELFDPGADQWKATGSLNAARDSHSATLLTDGKVLVVGGVDVNGVPLANAELYDPAKGTWTSAGSLARGRYFHTATLLMDGKVLVIGGVGATGAASNSVELYDPLSNKFTTLNPLLTARALQSATLLTTGSNAGKVLVMAGDDFNPETELKSVELYDPSGSGASTSSGVPQLTQARDNFTATLLSSGKVLAAGGHSIDTSVNPPVDIPLSSTELIVP